MPLITKVLCLAALLTALSLARAQTLPADPAAQQLQTAKDQYEKAQADAKTQIIQALQQMIDEQSAKGDIDQVTALQKALQAFQDNGTSPDFHSPALATALNNRKLLLKTTSAALLAAYNDAIAAATRAHDFDHARDLQKERDVLLQAAPSPLTLNLLKMIDPVKDSLKGVWTFKETTLFCAKGKPAVLEIPYFPPQEYDLHVEFTRTQGNDGTILTLCHNETYFAWCMGCWNNTVNGFEYVKGNRGNQNPTTTRTAKVFTNDTRYACEIKVRDTGVQAFIDGHPVAEWKTDYSDLTLPAKSQPKDKGTLAISTHDSVYAITKIELTEITGHGKPLRPLPAP